MKYARAAWRIFLAWSARKLHLPQSLAWDLEDEASMAMFACTLDFEPAQVTTRPMPVMQTQTPPLTSGGVATSIIWKTPS